MKIFTFLTITLITLTIAEPPKGPNDKAKCPVTGRDLNITTATVSVPFNNGQKLYFADEKSALAYVT